MERVSAILCVAVAAAGCYSPGYGDCEVTCAMSGACPDGLACVAGVCRVGGQTGTCGSAGGDGGPSDGLGIDAPPGVADEDGDGLLDNSDPCPISANNVDADSDGVGDNCEPIASGTDTLIRFEGFHASTAPVGAQVMGAWTFSGGAAHVTSSANVASSLTFALTTPSTRRTTVVAKVRIDAPQLSTADPTSAGVVNRTDGASSGIACGLGRDPGTSTDHRMLLRLGAAADANFGSLASIANVGTTSVVSMTRNPSNEVFACAEPSSTNAMIPSPVPTGTRAGIRTRSMNATFEWVMIFETQ